MSRRRRLSSPPVSLALSWARGRGSSACQLIPVRPGLAAIRGSRGPSSPASLGSSASGCSTASAGWRS
eukprot:2750337-Pyramimonas_sp.AAC.1